MNKIAYFRSVRSNAWSQDFGQNEACQYANGRVVGKVNGVCPIGSEELYPKLGLKGHNGIDRATWYGEPVYHAMDFDGWVKTEKDASGGIGVDVVSHNPLLKCTEPNCNETHYIKYRSWHHKSLPDSIWDGKQVILGELIAFADSTGLSGGNHVHESPKWCDRYGNGLHRDNGYYGAFDATKHPQIECHFQVFVLDWLGVKAQALSAIDLTNIVITRVREFIKGR